MSVSRNDRKQSIGLIAALDRLYAPTFSADELRAMMPSDESLEPKIVSSTDSSVKLESVKQIDNPVSAKHQKHKD